MNYPLMFRCSGHLAVFLSLWLLAGCGSEDKTAVAPTETRPATEEAVVAVAPATTMAAVDGNRIINADSEPGNWLTHGRTYDEQRYSPLAQINAGNVSNLGLAWYYDLDSSRGQESTPIVVDGVMYVSTAWSMVKALDARTGALKWAYDPQVPKSWGVYACCDVVNRGVAIWNNTIYFGTLDGRLIALDAATGKPAWEVLTIDNTKPYTITGAPRVINGKIIIGNGGSEYGVRGYVSAYDAETGALAWRFYTVPGDPSQPFEAPILAEAAKTWNGEWWKYGGGGTVWDSMAYDPDLNLLYIGTGNGAPWNQSIRSPGGGDNLFLSSIVALNASTGEYVWHYQTTPGETWDFTAAQHIILADLEINGQTRKVLMQVPKNGFFYVVDRTNGALISAQPVVATTWATHVDMATGRPVENPESRYDKTGKVWVGVPGPAGAHSWHPMSYNRQTGLVYVPINDAGFVYMPVQQLNIKPHSFNTGIDFGAADLPPDPVVKKQIMDSVTGHLAAWDPVLQRESWRVNYPGPWNGGVLSTAGNLVIQGTAASELVIYTADNGTKLWSMPVQTGVVAAPITYEVDGEQYIAVAAGWGGIYPLVTGDLAFKSGPVRNISRVIAFKLGGTTTLPPMPPETPRVLNPPELTADTAKLAIGKQAYDRACSTCHGGGVVSGGLITDLRYSPSLGNELFFEIVEKGLYNDKGMVSYADTYNHEELDAIQAYLIKRAHDSME
ncbi:MAG: PQQ-dependent dehydrogenase, methanol/ethanol family [Gammaproteobacteria bacterium]|nr:PQQ-dependent dehydrogenase, methanol/ethanol family [Gammaproteobacteria bacterium]